MTTVNISKHWVNVPASKPEYKTAQISVSKPIQNGAEIFGEVEVKNSGITFVEHVDVIFQASHPQRGLLTVNLYSPHGTRSKLATEHHDTTHNYPTNGWRFGSVRHWGESADGVWKVSAQDFKKRGGTFNWFKIVIYGY
jgi:kexin